jgi:hypothetical protein
MTQKSFLNLLKDGAKMYRLLVCIKGYWIELYSSPSKKKIIHEKKNYKNYYTRFKIIVE